MLVDLIAAEVPRFFELVRAGGVEIYNEVSLQHELGILLRARLAVPAKVQFERPVAFFLLPKVRYEKKEIDIAVFTPDGSERVAVELKFPRNGQYPEQMFSACRDIAFLEQLVQGGFSGGVFAMAVDDRTFRAGRDLNGIYAYFRGGQPISVTIAKPTGKRDRALTIRGRYTIQWRNVTTQLHYCAVEVGQIVPGLAR
jgi:hypothetical protein